MNVTGTETSAGSSTTRSRGEASADKAVTSDYETFLRMLTTQLQNQDPMNPMESDDFAMQLATFSGVEQQVKTNEIPDRDGGLDRGDGPLRAGRLDRARGGGRSPGLVRRRAAHPFAETFRGCGSGGAGRAECRGRGCGAGGHPDRRRADGVGGRGFLRAAAAEGRLQLHGRELLGRSGHGHVEGGRLRRDHRGARRQQRHAPS